ncbi:MAG: hypothetical protein U0236_03755 [Nitrospira sp.]
MITVKNQLLQLTFTAIVFGLVLGTLSMIWPGIIALFIGVLLLLQSCSAGQEIAVLLLTEVGPVSIGYASAGRLGLPTILA